MNKIYLTIITENQYTEIKAEKLSGIILNSGQNCNLISIEKYYKLENSFKLEFEILLYSEKVNLINEVLAYLSKIVTPWLIYYNEENKSIELIFNKSKFSRFKNNEFNTINWMQIQCE
ncbi:hypothetical protein NAL32_01280 [Chryseobacterium sp. Ch-15]|uniref:Uncharacterized protein n=1 Tax=Chryseobacterium muglaense TaxID=2893752 RepID=A0A9Q3USG6_9FLAO|nr:hypothetical protein [Chryseobacterium muglaense]MBD3903680.1 hypothetical protein [Chryseobacterium muglaense]MCC9034753.1 hypothetical protein [Chryseobacterium muglaense]MCM2553016.1 hypothetical protein [Chryseobacterium muglaense]